jgi:fibronectin type 3 domain-containing protein
MPLFTRYYGLGMKLATERYSSALDQERWTIIDSQTAFLTDIIGDGRIDGWTLSSGTEYVVTVASGMGLIDRFAVRTFGPSLVTLTPGTHHLFMLRRPNVLGELSNFSPAAQAVYSDASAPATPTSLTVPSRTRSTASLNWADNSEADLAGYRVYRSTDNTVSGWAAAATPVATVTASTYDDSGLADDTLYYYRVTAYDVSGNESSYAATTALTLEDLRTPAAARSLKLFPGNFTIQAIWLPSIDGLATTYEVKLQKLTVSGADDGAATTVTVSTRSSTFNSLDNDRTYRVTVRAVSKTGVKSEPVSTVAMPSANDGPDEVNNLAYTEIWDGKQITLKLTWATPATPASSYRITLEEAGQFQSNAFSAPRGLSTKIIAYNSVNPAGQRRIAESTSYVIRVQGVDRLNRASVGRVISLTTSKFSKPDAVSDLSVNLLENKFLRIGWENPANAFSRIRLTLKKTNLGDNVTTTLLNNVDLGKAKYYTFDAEPLEQNTVYAATVTAEDSVGNLSTSETATLSIDSTLPLPDAPGDLTADSYVNQMILKWSRPDTVENAKSYNVWRAVMTRGVRAADWVLLDNVPSDVNEFPDYAIDADTNYVYAVTTIDTYDNESVGPNDALNPRNMVIARSNKAGKLSPPEGLTATVDGASIVLEWEPGNEVFDGWQIYRADGGTLRYSLVGGVPHDTVTFTDDDLASLVNGTTYRYIVRKYINEAEVIFDDDVTLPENCITLGVAEVAADGTVTLDDSGAVDIKNLHDPVVNETTARLAQHKHVFVTGTDDRRIDLGTGLLVTGWTSEDSSTWNASQDVSQYGSFVVLVNGSPTKLFYQLDASAGRLTFERALDEGDVVSVFFDAVSETQGKLPASKVGWIDASSLKLDKLDKRAVRAISHRGRMGERLVPLSHPAAPSGPLSYNYAAPAKLFDTFYDVLRVSAGRLLAATSHGISLSEDAGHTWTLVQTTPSPCTRLMYSETYDRYFALACDTVYCATSLLTDWVTFGGMRGVSLVRDIASDADGRVFASTDVGVFRLTLEQTVAIWEQKRLPEQDSTGCHLIYYSDTLNAMVVGVERGLVYSTDGGDSWTLWSAFTQSRVAYARLVHDGNEFVLTEDRLYRRKAAQSEFSEVAVMPGVCRRVVVFRDRLYVATSVGLLSSVGSLTGDRVKFAKTLPQLSLGRRDFALTSLNVWSDRLYVGTDNRLYVSTAHGIASVQYQRTDVPDGAPTIYVNGDEQRIGAFWGSDRVVFDHRLAKDDVVTVATDYKKYLVENGPWADVDIKSRVVLYRDGIDLNLGFEQIGADSRVVSDDNGKTVAFPTPTSFVIPFPTPEDDTTTLLPQAVTLSQELSARNSSVTAAAILAEIDAVSRLLASEQQQTGLILATENIAALATLVLKLRAEVDDDVTVSILPVKVTAFDPNENQAVEFDPVTGAVTPDFTSPTEKYTDLTLDIIGVTLDDEGELSHAEIEDAFEEKLSGVPGGLGAISQINLLKTAMFVEGQWPGHIDSVSPLIQTELYAGCGEDWYDRFESTIDYTLRVRKANANVSLAYPACLMAVEATDELWVCGIGGILSIDTLSLAVSKVWGAPGVMVKSMVLDQKTVYVLADRDVLRIDTDTLAVTKDDGLGVPEGATSIAFFLNTIWIGAADGVYKKSQDLRWTKVVSSPGCEVKATTGDILVAYTAENRFFTTSNGDTWLDKGVPKLPDGTSIGTINAFAAGMTNVIATSQGLYDDALTTYGKEVALRPLNLPSSTSSDSETHVNDVATDGEAVVCGLSDGRYFWFESNSAEEAFVEHDESGAFEAIHKVAIVDGDVWLFGYDLVKIVSTGDIVKLASGNRLSWQT